MSEVKDFEFYSDVGLAQQGDLHAYERLVKHCQNLVTSIALAIVKDVDDSEEVAQQAFIAAWGNLTQLKNRQSFLPWIRHNTRYTAHNFLRNSKSKKRVSSEKADVIFADLSDTNINVEEQLIVENRNRALNQFIEELASDDREIVLLYYREEKSTKQVAQLLDLSESNVRKKLSRVRRTLKYEVLKDAGNLIFSSAPILGFSTLITGMLTTSAPVGASVLASGSIKTNTSVVVKIATIVGGALLGALIAVFVILWSSNMASKALSAKEKKQTLKRYRNETIAWVVVFGFAFSASYELSEGWVAPLVTYGIFALGVILLSLRTINFVIEHGVSLSDGISKLNGFRGKIPCYIGLTIGILTGFLGTVIGLIQQGRMPW